MYVATQRLKLGKDQFVEAGERVDAENWSEMVRRANINVNRIRFVSDAEAIAPAPEKSGEGPIPAFTCTECPGKEFKSDRALKIHLSKAHR